MVIFLCFVPLLYFSVSDYYIGGFGAWLYLHSILSLSILQGGDFYTCNFRNSHPCTVSTSSHCHPDFGDNDVGGIWYGLEDAIILLRGRFQSAFLKCSAELFLHAEKNEPLN